MNSISHAHLLNKEYLTIEQRKVVNWYRKVFQVRNTALWVVDTTQFFQRVKLTEPALVYPKKGVQARSTNPPSDDQLFLVEDVNDSALALFGYTSKQEFLSQAVDVHIQNYPEFLHLMSGAIAEGRQHIEIEASAKHRNGDTFKVAIEFIVPQRYDSTTRLIVSVACLSDDEPLSIQQFRDESIYSHFVDHAPVCIHEIDDEGKLASMNVAGLSMMQIDDVDEIKGLDYLDLVDEEDRARIETLLRRAQDGYSSEFEFSLVVNKSTRIFTSCFIPLGRKTEGRRRVIGVTQDITARKTSEEETYRAANFDALTRLRNRANFLDAARHMLAQAARHQHQLAFLLIDLDNFKPVNDTLGHEVGDLALQEFADRLRAVLREEDLACRFGGDEFVVVLPCIESVHNAKELADRLLKKLELPFVSMGGTSTLQASIGISIYPAHGDTCKELIRRADEAMYQAKRAGGHQQRVNTER